MIRESLDTPLRPALARSLKERTASAHERLDRDITRRQPFASLESYVRFLLAQHEFYRDIAALYANATVCARLPGLTGGERLGRIEQDLADLGASVARYEAKPRFSAGIDIRLPDALGWLYVAQGSNLGAAFLLKEAERLGLSDGFGARHLAGAPEGRGLHWRNFTAALDALDLSGEAETEAIEGANAAFDRFRELVEKVYV